MIYMFARQCKLSYCISASNNVTPIACQKISHGSKVELMPLIKTCQTCSDSCNLALQCTVFIDG